MKSVIKTNDLKGGIKYPCLMTAHSDSGAIVVLFYDVCCGVVVYSERELQPTGHCSKAWAMPSFEPFDGTIELSNN